MAKKYYGFIYEWTDLSNGLKYIGSHYGHVDDGYISSSKIFNRVNSKRTDMVERTIKEYIIVDDKSLLYEREQFYLSCIKNHELYNSYNRKNKTIKYYNMKKNAVGGNGAIGSNGKMKNKIKIYCTKSFVQKFIHKDETIPDGWLVGVPEIKLSSKNTKWYTNNITGEYKRFNYIPDVNVWSSGRIGQKTTPKKVSTPYGIFDSASECAKKIGIKSGTVTYRCRSKIMNEWFYIKE